MGTHAREGSVYARPTFWVGLGERSIATFAETLGGALIVGQAVDEVAWPHVLGVALVATIIAALKGLATPASTDTAVAVGGDS